MSPHNCISKSPVDSGGDCFSPARRASPKLILCSIVFFSHSAFGFINSGESTTNISVYSESYNHQRAIKNHRMNPDEVPKLFANQDSGGQSGLTFNVDFLEQPDQFEAGQSFFMPSRQIPLAPTYKQIQSFQPRDAQHSRWSIAVNQPDRAQQEAIHVAQDQNILTPPPTADQTSLNQTNTSLIQFDDDNDVKNQTVARITEELTRLREAERLLEKSLLDQSEIIRPKLINEINKQLASNSGEEPILPNNNGGHNLVVLHHSDDSMRGMIPSGNVVQHPRGTGKKPKLKLKKLSSLLKSSADRKRTPTNMLAQPTTTLPVVQINPTGREESNQDSNQFKRQMETITVENDNPKSFDKPDRKNDARFDRYSPQLNDHNDNHKQYQAYLKYLKSVENSNMNSQKYWPSEQEQANKHKRLPATSLIDEEDPHNQYTLPISPHLIGSPEEIDLSWFDGHLKDVNEYVKADNNRVPSASSFEYSSHTYSPPNESFKTKNNMPPVLTLPSVDDHRWSSLAPSRPRRYPTPVRYNGHRPHSGIHRPPPSADRQHDDHHDFSLAVGPSHHRAHKIRPTYEDDEYLESGGSHSHKVIHIHTKEKKKYGKYLWPILGGGLTMLMGFLIISNMLLSIPLLAMGASSLFNHGGYHSQQLVPIYNLSQLQPPRATGRRRKRWTDRDGHLTGDEMARRIEPRELLKRVLFSLSNRSNRCRVAAF